MSKSAGLIISDGQDYHHNFLRPTCLLYIRYSKRARAGVVEFDSAFLFLRISGDRFHMMILITFRVDGEYSSSESACLNLKFTNTRIMNYMYYNRTFWI